MLTVIQDHDYWYRIARNGRALRSRRGAWNLYRTKTGAFSGLRALLARVGG